MSAIKYVLGVDISTQTIRAMLVGVAEEAGRPTELVIRAGCTESRACGDELGRRNPDVWVKLVMECISGIAVKHPEAEQAEAVGISTTFPGCFAILRDGFIDPRFVALYDNTDDAGVCGGRFDDLLGAAESDTLSRMWPGNMAIGLATVVKSGLDVNAAARIVPPNTAFAHALLKQSGVPADPASLVTDFTQAPIGGLYDARTGEPLPAGVRALIDQLLPQVPIDQLVDLLPRTAPSFRNVIAPGALPAVRELLGLPCLTGVSIGAGDSPLGTLALMGDRDTVVNVRGSSDSPMIVVDSPMPRTGPRETVLHYPLPSAARIADSPWCVVAPMLRSGRVWDWVRSLRYPAGDGEADAKLEALALEAFLRKGGRPRPRFDPALGGERAPEWNSGATGAISGLVESHTLGDIALAALEGMSEKLNGCIRLMEDRYNVETKKLLLVGGPARNKLWNWVTQQITGKTTFATTFSDASLLGAALLGYGTAYDGIEPDEAVSKRLLAISTLSSRHPLISPVPVEEPASCAKLEQIL